MNDGSARRADRETMASVRGALAGLTTMTVGELAERYREVFGTPSRSRNKGYLRKHIAWRLQERIEGGLSERALDRIRELAPQAPVRWRRPSGKRDQTQASGAPEVRDPRLPPVGSVLTRLHDGVEHKVWVRAGGFDYNGQRHRSLSKIARLITGKSWNGYLFFLGRSARQRTDHGERDA